MRDESYRLLMIIGRYHPDIGGTEKACRIISKKLQETGFAVTVLTSHREGLPAYELIDGVPVYRYMKGWHLYEITYMLSVLSFLIRNRLRFDGIFCFGLYLFTAPAVLFARLTGKRVFFRLCGARETGDFYRLSLLTCKQIILWFARKAHGAIALSTELEQELQDNDFPERKIFRLPNAVDTCTFNPARKKAGDPFTICYIGRLAKGKGLETLIRALAVVKKQTTAFNVLIVGEGTLRNQLEAQVEKLGLSEHVCFTGQVDNVQDYYHQSHLFVLPSSSEGMPHAMLEAMACGLAVVATPVGGIRDIMQLPRDILIKESSGYRICSSAVLVQPGNETALAESIMLLFRDRELCSNLGKNARSSINSSYALEKVIADYARLFSR